MSGFRLGLIIGGAIGYVLGAKAGRQRYEHIRSWWRSMMRSDPAQQLTGEFREIANRAGQAIEDKASEQVSRITERVRSGEPEHGQAEPVPPQH